MSSPIKSLVVFLISCIYKSSTFVFEYTNMKLGKLFWFYFLIGARIQNNFELLFTIQIGYMQSSKSITNVFLAEDSSQTYLYTSLSDLLEVKADVMLLFKIMHDPFFWVNIACYNFMI